MAISPADAATLLGNRETAPKTASVGPKSWLVLQPNPGGIAAFKAALESVNRNPLSKNLTDEAGDIVGMSVMPTITHDLTLDFARFYAGDWFRCLAKHASPSGVAFFRPTALVDGGVGVDHIAVDAGGAVGDSSLVRLKGFANAANNAVFVTSGGPIATEIRVPTGSLVAEAVAPANSTAEVVGFEAVANAEITMEADGDLAANGATDFTTHGLVGGMIIKIGDPNVVASQFDVEELNGYAEVDPTRAITTATLPLRRHTFTPAANAAAGKKIRILTPLYFANYPYGHANHQRATSQLELEVPAIGTGDASSFRYGKGLACANWKINAPLKNKVTIEMTFVGLDMPDPTLQAGRPADTATALEPLDARMFDTSSDLKFIALRRASNNALLVDEINGWTANVDLTIKPQEAQGVVGAKSHIHGKIRPALSLQAYHKTDETTKVERSNADVYFWAVFANEDGGVAYNLPAGKLRNGDESFAEGDAVMLSVEQPSHRETATNRAASLSLFGYLG